MTYRIKNVAIAIALALTAALLTMFYVSNYKRSVQQGEADVQVFVATHDIPTGLTGSQIGKRHLLEPRDVARRTVVPGAISDPSEIARLVVTHPVYAGEQVTTRRFGTTEARGLRGQLHGTLRAVQVPGDANQLLVGTLLTGDRVDMVSNIDQSHAGPYARIVVRDIEVLRGPTPSDVSDRANASSHRVMLALRDTQVQRFWFGIQNGDWTLELRPKTESADSKEVVDTTESVFYYGSRAAR
jgi:Flp pilus assembly protein CpaB